MWKKSILALLFTPLLAVAAEPQSQPMPSEAESAPVPFSEAEKRLFMNDQLSGLSDGQALTYAFKRSGSHEQALVGEVKLVAKGTPSEAGRPVHVDFLAGADKLAEKSGYELTKFFLMRFCLRFSKSAIASFSRILASKACTRASAAFTVVLVYSSISNSGIGKSGLIFFVIRKKSLRVSGFSASV